MAIGWYPIDLHPCVGRPDVSLYASTHPFQLPLGALIPRRTRNLLAACKNVGVTHVANGATRLQPVEWAIGEAAGTLAALCLAQGATPHEVWASPALTRALQRKLLRGGAPVRWTLDAPPGHPAFVAEQERALEVARQVRR